MTFRNFRHFGMIKGEIEDPKKYMIKFAIAREMEMSRIAELWQQ